MDGRVLLAGGGSAAIYDPETSAFTAIAGQGQYSGIGPSATLLPDGRVLLAGGWISETGPFQLYTTQSEIFDPSTNSFAPPQFMYFAKACPSAVLLNNGKVLIAGGSAYTEPFGEASAEAYDPVSATFTVAGPYASSPSPDGRLIDSNQGWCPNAFLRPDGKVAILWQGEGVDGVSEVFDPATNTFSALPTPSFQYLPQVPGVQLASGLVLFTGGNDGLGASTLAGLYDPNSGLVTPTGNMNTARTDQTMVLLPDGTVLVAGGQVLGLNVANRGVSSAELFDPTSGTFNPTGNMLAGAFGQTATVLLDGTVLMAGGYGGGSGPPPNSIYHPNKLVPAPALFALSGDGTGQGAIWNASTGQVASGQNPAAAGDVLSMYTTSLIEGGAVPPYVSVGGVLAKVLFFGDAPGYPGYFQVNFQLPSGAPTGSDVPVRLMYFGRASNAVTIALR
ncbi:MAG: hypothetical protein ABSB15_23390 [Bryobacteraceae bacterium]|jgi:hypothetical protein